MEQTVDPHSSSVQASPVLPAENGVDSASAIGSIQTVDQLSPSTKAEELLRRMSPLPKCSKQRQRKRAAESAEVLTSSPYKRRLIEKACEKGETRRNHNSPHPKNKSTKPGRTVKSSKKKTCGDGRRRRKKNEAGRRSVNGLKNHNQAKKNGPRRKLTLKTAQSASDDNLHYYCPDCMEPYNDPPVETWIQCKQCKGWCHETCTAGETARGFVCVFSQ
jgi:hypothetical protein